MPRKPTSSPEAVAASVERREERDGTKRIVVSAFVDADRVEEAKAAMKEVAKKFAPRG